MFGRGAVMAALASQAASYEIAYALDFKGEADHYLSQVLAGNRKTWTFSAWIKRNSAGSKQGILYHATSGDDGGNIMFPSTDSFAQFDFASSSYNSRVSGGSHGTGTWNHFVATFDTTRTGDHVRLYKDGSLITADEFNVQPSADYQGYIFEGGANTHRLGHRPTGGSERLDAKMADVYLLDGVVVGPTAFGKSSGGSWVPIEYTGSFGSAGSFLNWSNSGDLGEDQSGNGNDWTVTGLNSGDDRVTDTPTNPA